MAIFDKIGRGIQSLISPATQQRNRMGSAMEDPLGAATQQRNRMAEGQIPTDVRGGVGETATLRRNRIGGAMMAAQNKVVSDAMQQSAKTINRLIAEGKIPAADREMLLRKLLREIQENARLQAASRPIDSIELSKKALATILGGAAVAGGTAGVALDKMRDAGWGENAANFLMDWVSPVPRGMGFEGGPSKYQTLVNATSVPASMFETGLAQGVIDEAIGETEAMQQIPEQQGIGSLRRLRR